MSTLRVSPFPLPVAEDAASAVASRRTEEEALRGAIFPEDYLLE